MAACGARWHPYGDPPDPLSIPFQIFDGSIVRCLDAGGWLELSAGGEWSWGSEL